MAELKQALSQQGQQAKLPALAPRPSPGRGRVTQLLECLSGASTQTGPIRGARSGRRFGRTLRRKLGRWVGVSAWLAAVGCGQQAGVPGRKSATVGSHQAGQMDAGCLW